MPVNLKGRSFLTLKDFTPDEIRYLLKLAANLKDKKRAGIRGKTLEGKNIVLLFEKASTRTRCSFEVAAKDEGAGVTYLTPSMCHMRKKESWADTGAVLGRYYDGIEYRGFEQSTVETLAANAGVPVWNGLTDVDHPTQILADLLTIQEHLNKPLDEVRLHSAAIRAIIWHTHGCTAVQNSACTLSAGGRRHSARRRTSSLTARN